MSALAINDHIPYTSEVYEDQKRATNVFSIHYFVPYDSGKLEKKDQRSQAEIDQCIETAIECVRLGWALLPLQPRSKEPHFQMSKQLRGTAKWRHDENSYANKRANEDEIRKWFEIDPNLNIGVICGEPSGGLVVFDFDDTPPSGFHVPVTPQTLTRRGFHVYFTTEHKIQCGQISYQGKTYGDIKADGGVVVMPGSIHESGHHYGWADFLSPSEAQVEKLPETLMAYCKVARPKLKLTKRQLPKEGLSNNIISPTNDGLWAALYEPSTLISAEMLRECARREDIALAQARVLGIPDVQLGSKFRCILHKEKHPSASLYAADNGVIVYREWHHSEHGCKPALTLSEVFASLEYGYLRELAPSKSISKSKPHHLNKPEFVIWQLRLLAETGIMTPCNIPAIPLPDYAPTAARKVYDGLIRLLSYKWRYSPGEPTAFSRHFASAWCGMGERQAGEAINLLKQMGYLVLAGKQGRTQLWLPVMKSGA
jgi:hypothetical protein